MNSACSAAKHNQISEASRLNIDQHLDNIFDYVVFPRVTGKQQTFGLNRVKILFGTVRR